MSDIDRSAIIIDNDAPAGGSVDLATSTATLAPLDAISYLSSPFHVIVENELYDGAFLLWMAKAIGYDKLILAYKSGIFIFRHAGGKDVFPRCAEVLRTGVFPDTPKYQGKAMSLWAAAFLDSDSKHPAHNPNEPIISRTAPHVTFIQQLKRRSIENYIPQHYLEMHSADPEHRRKVAALGRLTEDQKTHFQMKVGFKPDRIGNRTKASYNASTDISSAEKSLFSTVPDADFSTLAPGFGDGLSEVFRSRRTRSSGNDRHLTNANDKAELLDLCRSIFGRL